LKHTAIMGCGASSGNREKKYIVGDVQTPVQTFDAPLQQQPSTNRLHSCGRRRRKIGKFQIMLEGQFVDYGEEEDGVLKRAYLVGQPNCCFALRGQEYGYSFIDMEQRNLISDQRRRIRPPEGLDSPQEPLLPPGPMVVVCVQAEQAGMLIEISDPNNPGKRLQVNVPPVAKPGQKIAVPVPEAGQDVQAVQEKQNVHFSTSLNLSMGVGGVAAVAGIAVAGVIIGDHLSIVADAIGDGAGTALGWSAGLGDTTVDWLGDAAGDGATALLPHQPCLQLPSMQLLSAHLATSFGVCGQ